MTIAIYMKDVLDPVQVDEDFVAGINMLNMAAAQGKQFMIMDDCKGGHVGINIPNINLLLEVED